MMLLGWKALSTRPCRIILEVVGGEFGASSVGATALVLGFVSAFVSGLLACKVMIALVKKAKLSWFALYCLLAAAAIFIFA